MRIDRWKRGGVWVLWSYLLEEQFPALRKEDSVMNVGLWKEKERKGKEMGGARNTLGSAKIIFLDIPAEIFETPIDNGEPCKIPADYVWQIPSTLVFSPYPTLL